MDRLNPKQMLQVYEIVRDVLRCGSNFSDEESDRLRRIVMDYESRTEEPMMAFLTGDEEGEELLAKLRAETKAHEDYWQGKTDEKPKGEDARIKARL